MRAGGARTLAAPAVLKLPSRFVFLLLAWTGLPARSADTPPAPPPPEDPLVAAAVQSSNALAADVFARLRAAPGNVAFAPLGLAQALLPVAAGAHGATAEEAHQALRLAASPAEAADGFTVLTRRLQAAAGGDGNLAFVRALWVQQWNALNPEYVEFLRQHCRSELRVTDFAQPEATAHWMDRWVADRTGNRFPVWFEPARPGPDACLVVGSAVAFRAPWQWPFDVAATETGPFLQPAPAEVPAVGAAPAGSVPPVAETTVLPTPVPAPRAIVVPFMHRSARLRLVEAPDCRLLELPYRGGKFSFVVVVPAPEVPLEAVERQVSADRVTAWLAALQEVAPALVEVRVPRFRAERAVAMAPLLLELGLSLAFDRAGAANFSILGENPDARPIYLSAVNQQVGVAIDETGGQAVSSPAAVVEPFDTPVEAPPLFAVDRPFVYFIADTDTGALLFLGRVVDPRAG